MADQQVEVHYSTGRFRLEIMAERNDHHAELKSPSSGKMTERIRESMTAKVQVKLISGKGPKEEVVFEGTGINTGFEMGGKTELLKEI
jgi:hypothetical protein